MKSVSKSLAAMVALLALSVAANAAPTGSTFVSYSVDTPLISTGLDTNATGNVRLFVKQQGNSDHQKFAVKVSNLDPSTPYTLLATVGEAVDPTIVTTFTTGSSGKGSVMYFQNRALKANGHKGKGAGVSKHALPLSLTPLTDVRYLSIANTNGEVILSLSVHEAESLSYEVATTFANTGSDPDAIGCMAMAIQSGHTQFRLFASGRSSQYSLWVNDAPVANYFADGTGSIAVGSFPSKAPSPMKFREVCVKNVSEAIVLASSME